MKDPSTDNVAELASKIARLVEERGWSQEYFAQVANLNRQTIRRILRPTGSPSGEGRLRNATICACAKALGLSVHDLRSMPLERLLARRVSPDDDGNAASRRLYEQATQPELQAWIERNPDRAAELTELEIDELLSLQGTGGPLTAFGVEHFVGLVLRKRNLADKVNAIAGTEYLELLEQMVDLLYEKVQPYPENANRGQGTGNRD